ncbi:hypothetical protein B0H11DRAFT_1966301 [Mycena galericulata]|nr:hypothetical protein B0H11DRAFT_1966301 [Mycena galericulata]
MHDVNVQKKKRKRRATAQADSDSDDGTAAPSANKKSKRKKRKNRRQQSRSIREIEEERQRIILAAYPIVQEVIVTQMPWPTASPTGDPGAEDDKLQEVINYSWDNALESLDLDPDDFEAPTTAERNLIHSRIAQVRGAVMTVADAMVPIYYKFVDPHSLPDPTPEAMEAVMETNRQLVDSLHKTYMYKNPLETGDIADICRHPIFQQVLNKAFFAKSGANRRAHYFKDAELLPVETLGLVMDAVMCGIDRWKTGVHDTRAVPFDTRTYGPIHVDTLTFLAAWVDEYQRAEHGHPVDLSAVCLREMLEKGRKAAGAAAVEQALVQTSRFPMDVFSAARRTAAPAVPPTPATICTPGSAEA